MTFRVVIPARLGSTRLPDKPLADLGGKPMIVRVAERAQLSRAQEVIVATDAQSIMDACSRHNIRAIMTLDTHPSGTDRIAEVARTLRFPDASVVVNVQGDEPLIDPELINSTADRISGTTLMATAACHIDSIDELFNPNIVKVVLDKEGRALYFSRAPVPWDRAGFSEVPGQMSPEYAALRHIGIYAYRNDFLLRYPSLSVSPVEAFEALEQLRALWHGVAISVHMAASAPVAGVDTPEDLDRVRQYFMQNNR